MANQRIIPIILSGGSGTRLWPVSREASPKPFMVLSDGESLLQKAFKRASALPEVTEIIVVTREDFFWRSEDHFRACQIDGVNIQYLLEPFGRNTGGAITLATLFAKQKYGDDITLLVLSADHLIDDQDRFTRDVSEAVSISQHGLISTFGISPTHAETAYGYIEKGAHIKGTEGYHVERFTEKPNSETAERFLEEGRYLWNAGIFCFRISDFEKEVALTAPALLALSIDCLNKTQSQSSPIHLDSNTFEKLPNVSIDHAVLEKSRRVAVVPAHFDWQDIGSWDAMAKLTDPDQAGNRNIGEVYHIGTTNSYVHSPHRLATTIGVENLLIIDTPDALLVAHKDRAQDVKSISEHLKSIKHEGYLLHRTVHRPWGTYTILEEGKGFKIKRIAVKPGATLSLQSHVHRSEHWVVIEGQAKVINEEDELILEMSESAFVKAGNKHRLTNPHETDMLTIIETQVGPYLGEDDIERYDDTYGRK